MLNEEKKWYEKAGKESDVVISTRVRLARNLADMPFPNRMTPDQKAAVERRVRDATSCRWMTSATSKRCHL